MPLDPSRTVEELRELQELTGDENGAQRVAWTDTWAQAREWLRGKLAGLPVDEQVDEAGNQWFTLSGASEGFGVAPDVQLQMAAAVVPVTSEFVRCHDDRREGR